DWPAFVHRRTGDIKHAAHDSIADGHGNRFARIGDLQAAFQTLGAGHGNRSDAMVAELLLDFEGERYRIFLDFEVNGEGVVDAWNFVEEFHIHYRADYLDDFAFFHFGSIC